MSVNNVSIMHKYSHDGNKIIITARESQADNLHSSGFAVHRVMENLQFLGREGL